MKQYIRARILNMSQAEILEIIPKDTIERIRKADATPEFRVYCVGHEGDAQAQELSFAGKVSKAFHYVKEMVLKIAEKVQYGTPLFHLHAGANTGDGREQLGEVVGKGVKMIQDRLSALAAVYLYPQYRKMQLDVASIEANIVYVPKSATSGDVIDVEQVTGIALASSATEKPAFPGATLLGAIQALRGAETMAKMTKEEIKEAIKESGLKITDIYDEVEIVDSEPAQKAKAKEREYGKRKEKELNEEHERLIDLQKKHDETIGKVKVLTEKVNSTTSKTLVDASVTSRKLGDKQKAFINKNLATFKSDKEGEELKQDVERFVDAQIKEFDETAKLLGVEVPAGAAAGAAGAAAGAGTPNADGTGAGTKDDLTDPKNNDFIPPVA